jgi:hypothetical protein
MLSSALEAVTAVFCALADTAIAAAARKSTIFFMFVFCFVNLLLENYILYQFRDKVTLFI